PLRCGPYTLPFGRRTYVVGILNLTDDSFTGDGVGADVEAAVRKARQLVADGADVIDIGAESSEARDHQPIPPEQEIARLLPVLRRLLAELPVPISVDTWKAPVAAAVLAEGAHIINDVGGLRRDPALARVVAERGAPVVIMHSQAEPRYRDVVADIVRFFAESLAIARRAGIPETQVVLDVGFGFGKNVHQDLETTRRLREFRSLGRPLMHAPSRKRTIGRVLGVPTSVEERLMGTAAMVALGIAGGADFVRVHDVAEMARLVRMADACVRGWDGVDAGP
ncbi:MAG: dihydropteroate synthase, partial [Clostridia bacterium]|nr:dihydropteroate synthase [Clostridia bacterium]